MTNEQIVKCSQFDKEFKWATRSNFVHMSNREFSVIAALYKDVFGEALSKTQMTCNTCRLNAIKRLASAYYDAVQEQAELEKAKRLEENELKENKSKSPAPKKKGTTTTQKKSGRPKKIDID